MTDTDVLKSAFREPPKQSARQRRAERTRRRALSPVRIILTLLGAPVLAVSLTVSIYLKTSAFSGDDALRHLVALAGCPAAAAVGVAPAAEGAPGYHPRNDPDGNGVACEGAATPAVAAAADAVQGPGDGTGRMQSGAKFVRP